MNSFKRVRHWLPGIGLLIAFSCGAQAAPPENNSDKKESQHPQVVGQSASYSKKGADTCLKCHDEDSDYPVLDIFKTAHGNQGTKHGPFSSGSRQCETCHGPAGNHVKKRLRKGKVRQPMISFERNEATSVIAKNEICLNCHQNDQINHWQGSIHQLNDTACSDCHQIHNPKDPMSVKSAQIQQCGQCHVSQKLAMNRTSTHPLRYGQMGCSDCHQSHDSDGEKLLQGETVNATCYQCHAEKRGPFIWEHEPVTDSCINCHSPHGSNQKAMLTQRPPYLCQNCHSGEGHSSFSYDSGALPSGKPSALLLGRSCANCHSQVHGSNHPSGSRLQR